MTGHRWASALLLGSLLSGCATVPEQTAATTQGATTRSWLERDLPGVMEEAEVPGLGVALIEGGEVTWTRGLGVMNTETRKPVSEDTVFEAASLSKPVFAYAALKLVDSGKLDLDTPLVQYLPGERVPQDARLRRITARHVLSHSAGLPNWRPTGKPLSIHFEPGERFSYSGEGIVYLQEVVERVTGLPFDTFMRQSVFEPLGMTSSGYVWQESQEDRRAYRHDAAGHPEGRARMDQPNAAASLATTTGDYARFVTAILRGEGLKESTWKEMTRPQVRVDEACTQCLDKAPEKLSPSLSWGLGWGLWSDARGGGVWHWGDNGSMKAFIAADLGTKRGVVMFANSANGLSLTRELLRRVMPEAPGAPLAWLKYQPYDAPARRQLRDILARGETAFTEERQRRVKAGEPPNESETNQLGYALLAHGRTREAVAIFRSNAEDFPNSGNTHDSLGEAYLKSGDKARALQEYQRARELDPGNGNAVAVLRWLRLPEHSLPPALLAGYVGAYQTPIGRLEIFVAEGRLRVRLGERPALNLAPLSETRFLVEMGTGEVELGGLVDGVSQSATLLVDGQRFEGKRVDAP